MKLTYFAVTGLVLLLAAGGYLMMQTDMDGRMKEMQADYDRKLELLEKKHKEQQPAAAALSNIADARAKADEREAAAKGTISKAAAKVDKESAGDGSVSEALNNVKATLKNRTGELAAKDDAAGDARPVEPGDAALIPAEILAKEQSELLNSSGVGVERIAEENAELSGDVPPGKRLTSVQSLVVAQPFIAKVKDSRKADQADFVVLDQGSDKGLTKGDSFAVRRGTAIIGRVVIGETVLNNECIADIVPEKLVTGMVLQPGDEIIKFDR